MKNTLVNKSKYLSLILRHDPASAGITLDTAGWVSVEALLKAAESQGIDRTVLDVLVNDNNKKRFEFSPDGTQIRACQGHSVEVELGYEEKTPPDVLWHGSYREAWSSISVKGLLPMARHHVHLSVDAPTACVVARRRKDPILLEIDAKAMHLNGSKFFLSANGVWLTDHVAPKHIVLRAPFPKS